jgi:hypothetical protein
MIVLLEKFTVAQPLKKMPSSMNPKMHYRADKNPQAQSLE